MNIKFEKQIRRSIIAMNSLADVDAYLWGGLIPDVYVGSYLREHDDIEYLVVNLNEKSQKIKNEFSRLGWITEDLVNGDLKIKFDDFKIQLGALELKNKQAYWYHNGNKGYISFPASWINDKIIKFYGLTLKAVEPEFQYSLKMNPTLMNPNWQARDKDLYDINRLKKLLNESGVSIKQLNSCMKSVITSDHY